ncbi:hypothetical protein CEXT_767271 [Caerostris extrusa]|uniref:Uncharacterized protein n=1 Tax=Caerostris extrusa TaxID=172846 RepID=A0AAV4XA50_CAEEX|nr:hypothetical protein CEXT_767271 [Caerostris extrusa]
MTIYVVMFSYLRRFKRLITDLLLSSSALKILIENMELHKNNQKWKTSLPEETSSNILSRNKESPSLSSSRGTKIAYISTEDCLPVLDIWISERSIPTTALHTIENYLQHLTDNLKKVYEIAFENAKKSAKYNIYPGIIFVQKRSFIVGEKLLVLLP